uniref:Uncharacterized protein n=1 Tax=Arundo donax TaxID=35708 RepID=A0A0A9BW42_ARUDO
MISSREYAHILRNTPSLLLQMRCILVAYRYVNEDNETPSVQKFCSVDSQDNI